MKKKCTKCGTPKNKEGFAKNEKCTNGRTSICKTCLSEINKKYYYKKEDPYKMFVG